MVFVIFFFRLIYIVYLKKWRFGLLKWIYIGYSNGICIRCFKFWYGGVNLGFMLMIVWFGFLLVLIFLVI